MITLSICIMILFTLIIIYVYMQQKPEYFYASSCQELASDNGLICSIKNSPLYSNKCYRIKQSFKKTYGE